MVKLMVFVSIVFFSPLTGWCDYNALMSSLENYAPPPVSLVSPGGMVHPRTLHGDVAPTASLVQKKMPEKVDSQHNAFSVMETTSRVVDTDRDSTHMDKRSEVQPIDKPSLPDVDSQEGTLKKIEFFVIPSFLAKKLSGVDRDEKKAASLLKHQIFPGLLAGMTLLRNPRIAQAHSLVDAELATHSQVADLDLVLSQYAAFTKGLMNGVGPVKGRSSIDMGFPFPGVTALKGQVVAQSVAAAREGLAMAERDAVTQVQEAFWNLVYLIKARDITRETLAVFKNLHGVADSLYRSGKTGFQDVTRVTVNVHILEDALVTIQEKQQNIQAVIFSLVNLPPGTFLGQPVPPSPSFNVPKIETLYTRAQRNRQELKQIRAVIGKMERMVEMAETTILPDFDLGFSRNRDDAVTKVGSLSMASAFPQGIPASMGKGVPKKPWYGVGASWLTETRKRLTAKREKLKTMEAQTRKMVRRAWYELDRAVRTSKLYGDTVVGLSATALDVSTREYESGRVPFADVAGAYSDWLKARLAHARGVSDIGIYRAKLGQIIGTES